MKMVSILVFCILIQSVIAGTGGNASGEGDPPLVGNPCPDFLLEQMINFPRGSVRISEMRGKAVILDLWGTWCGSCVAALPKVDSIQNVFRNQLQVVLISSEKASKVESFLGKLEATQGIRLASAIDTGFVIGKALGVRFVPHYLWIDARGIIRGATDEKALTLENVRLLVEGKPITALPVKVDDKRVPDSLYGSLMNPAVERSEQLVSTAVLIRTLPGQSSTVTTYRTGPFADRRLRFTRYPVVALFAYAAGEGDQFPESRIVLEHPDTLRLWPDIADAPDSLKKANYYNYEIVEHNGMLYHQMERDLCNRFSVTIRREKRLMPCLVLRAGKARRLQPTRGVASLDQSAFWFMAKSQPIGRLIEAIRMHTADRRIADVVDLTGLDGKYTLDLFAAFADVPALTDALARYGLLLTEEMRETEVLIISPEIRSL